MLTLTLAPAPAAPRYRPRSKYRACRVTLDGHSFDSKREAAVYAQLKLLAQAGEINAIEVHPRIDLHTLDASGVKHKIGAYELDFRFWDAREKRRRFVDVKGFQTPLSDWKRKHAIAEYQIDVELWR